MEIAIVYLLAGLSKRFLGKPKGLARIGPNGETLIEYSLDQSLKAGFTKIIFIVSEKTKELYQKTIGENYKEIPIKYAIQEFNQNERDRPWGTFDALCSALPFIDSPFVICNGDDIYGEEPFRILYNHLKNEKTPATIGYKLKNVLPEEGKANRGIFDIEKGFVKSIIETFDIDKSNLSEKGLTEESLCSMNIFAFQKEIIPEFNKSLLIFKENHKLDKTIECLLPNEISNLIKSGKLKVKICPTEDKTIGLTYPEDEEKVRNELKKITQ